MEISFFLSIPFYLAKMPKKCYIVKKGGMVMDTSISLFRKRHIPQECLPLNKDKVLYLDDSILITQWNTIHPRKDFASGTSVFDFKNHWKITRVAKEDGSLYHWYCDIMKMEINKETNTYVMVDLLVDVVIEADNSVHVLDLDEVADAYEQGLITSEELTLALRSADRLLRLIRDDASEGGFSKYLTMIEKYI